MKKLKIFLDSLWGQTLLGAVVWQALMTLIGLTIQTLLVPELSRRVPPGYEVSLLSHTAIWDAVHYLNITQFFYGPGSSDASGAFWPLFPLLVRLVGALTLNQVSALWVGLLVNTLMLWLTMMALLRIAEHILGAQARLWPLIMMMTAPTAYYFHLFYSEATYAAIGFWAYEFALQRKFRNAFLLIALLGLARLPFLLFLGLITLEFWRANDWRIGLAFKHREARWLFATPAGFVAFGLWMRSQRDDFFYMFTVYAKGYWPWHQRNLNIFQTIGTGLGDAYRCLIAVDESCALPREQLTSGALPALSLVTIALTGLFALRLRGVFIPLGAMCLAACIMFTLNGNVVSVHRYALCVLPIYLVAGEFFRRRPEHLRLLAAWSMLGLMSQALLMLLAIGRYFVG
jgi:hypothetical protein